MHTEIQMLLRVGELRPFGVHGFRLSPHPIAHAREGVLRGSAGTTMLWAVTDPFHGIAALGTPWAAFSALS
jgi:hypothetical protein